jgi:hypothetical protein
VINQACIGASDLARTIVRAPKLINGPASGTCRIDGRIHAAQRFPMPARGDRAAFLLNEAECGDFMRRTVAIAP